MSELLDVALTLFVASQAIGILMGVIVALITIVYVAAKTLLDINQ